MYSSDSGANRISTSDAGDRLFVYEVAGLSQKKETDNLSYPIRRSGSDFYTVPYQRMNQEMRRITRLGGRIVSIKPLNTDSLQPSPAPESPPSQGNKKNGKSMTQAPAKKDIPVNIYRPNSPYIGKCIENYA
jgi:ferredoxin--NADP+ reductase